MPYIKLTAPMIVREVEGPHGDFTWDTELAIKTWAVKEYLRALVLIGRIKSVTADTILALNREADISAFGNVAVTSDASVLFDEPVDDAVTSSYCFAEVNQEAGSIQLALRKRYKEEVEILQDLFPYVDIVSRLKDSIGTYIAPSLKAKDDSESPWLYLVCEWVVRVWLLEKKDITEGDIQAVILAHQYREKDLFQVHLATVSPKTLADTYIAAVGDIKRALGLCKQIHERGELRAQAFNAALIAGYIDMDALEAFLNTSTEGPYWEFAGDVKRYVNDHLPAVYRLD